MDFKQAYKALDDTNRLFAAGKISAWEYGNQRATALAATITAMAAETGVTLQQPMGIDGNGEFSIVALHESGRPPSQGAGAYSEEFCAALNRHRPRTGMVGAACTLLPENGWCRMNHFDAEKMVIEHFLKVEKLFPFEADNGIPYMARLVERGDRYGRNGCLTHDREDADSFGPMVEFYDLRYKHDDWPVDGYFVSRYYTQTFCESKEGVLLQQDDQRKQDWVLSAKDKAKVMDWIAQMIEPQATVQPRASRSGPSAGM